MPNKPNISEPREAEFFETLIVAEGLYQAARALYERISKDTGFPDSDTKTIMLDAIQKQGKLIRTTIDNAVQQFAESW